MSISGPSAPKPMRLVTSTTVLPATAGAISAATSAKLVEGIARMTMSPAAAAAAFEVATVAPVAAAAAPASSGSREAIVTLWPARTNAVERALPTLPAPMMLMSTRDLLSVRDEFVLVNRCLLWTDRTPSGRLLSI